jgi:Carboxypeptidase regulatory-like domain/TonB-dependent Receptor Plug Domain
VKYVRHWKKCMWDLGKALAVVALAASPAVCSAQTANTGAVTGTVTDPSGAVVPSAHVEVISEATGATRKANLATDGAYRVSLLPPGFYRIQASATGFKLAVRSGVPIQVTEVTSLNIELEIGSTAETVLVNADPQMTQTESGSLGRVTDQKTVENLPLVTRNFTQIIGLSPGVNVGLTDATQLGSGTGGMTNYSNEDVSVNGARGFDNNFQMDGVNVNELDARGTQSGGVAIPNPDSITEFKVQTGQYDASYGRNAGASVNVVTRSGSNQLHGNLFEFFRNEDLNANSFFFNRLGVPRGILRQNQFGGTVGGPIKKDKLLYFGSYQGTRQSNGVGSGCSSTFVGAPFTNDRSPAALGAIFGGQTGSLGGVAIAPDGSNINPVALTLLNQKLPNGDYVVPTPRAISDGQGEYAFSIPCTYNEDQFITNVDFLQSAKSKLAAKFFFSNQNYNESLVNSNTPGSPSIVEPRFRNFSLSHDYVVNSNMLNQLVFAFHRTNVPNLSPSSFTFPGIGSTVIPQSEHEAQIIVGEETLGAIEVTTLSSNVYTLQDTFTYNRGRHNLRVGGGVTRTGIGSQFLVGSFLQILSTPDLLLGQSALQNGSPYSNIYYSYDLPGQLYRNWHVWNPWAYAQDDFKIHPRLTLNLGFRWEQPGFPADQNGRNSTFSPALADPNPPASGSQAGYVLPSNFKGAIPQGSVRLNNKWAINGDHQNTLAPRIGFAWQIVPGTASYVLRGGYGIYYSTFTGDQLTQQITVPPFAEIRIPTGTANAAATLANPFGPLLSPSDFPIFPTYSPTTQLSLGGFALNARPQFTQEYSLNLQAQVARDFLLEVGFTGSRGEHLVEYVDHNQATLASATNPIRGETTNTLANLSLRVPFEGLAPGSGLGLAQTTGASWYNSLQVSMSKRVSHGLQFLSYYSFSRLLDTAGGQSNSAGIGGFQAPGDQTNPRARYGASSSIRPHRFLTSLSYDVPRFASGKLTGRLLNDWSVYGVSTLQSGHPLTVVSTNANNVYGINGYGGDFGEFASGCNRHMLKTPGSVKSKLNGYFNQDCVAGYQPVGDDGMATGFGNMGVGLLNGPGQANFDLALTKRVSVNWFDRDSTWEFRSEFFNAFNSTNFADPDVNISDGAAFGVISGTIANPRVIQFALKYSF